MQQLHLSKQDLLQRAKQITLTDTIQLRNNFVKPKYEGDTRRNNSADPILRTYEIMEIDSEEEKFENEDFSENSFGINPISGSNKFTTQVPKLNMKKATNLTANLIK